MQIFWHLLRTPEDDSLNRIINLDCGFAEIGIEAEVPDVQGEVVGTGFTVLLLPNDAAIDQLAAERTAEITVRGGHRMAA